MEEEIVNRWEALEANLVSARRMRERKKAIGTRESIGAMLD